VNYDSPETFFFLDPPYVNAPTDAYEGWSEEQMKEFRGRVGKLKGKWLATVDDSDFNRKLFSGCAINPVSSQNRLCNNRTHSSVRFGELIITPK
jgi:DNA adenine methylase